MISTLPTRAFSAPRRSVLKLGFTALFSAAICTYLFYYLTTRDTWRIKDFKFSTIFYQQTRRPDTTHFCTAEQYANGRWARRADPPTTLDEIRTLYGVKDRGRLECDPPGWPVMAKGQVLLEEPTHIARMLNQTRWMWEPQDDCRRWDMSEEAFVVRMLRSRAGLILVGDSLSEQHHEIVRNFLVSHGGPYQLRMTGSRPRVDEVFLDPHHELTKHYLRLAGVTAERLKNPITTFFLERHLLSMAEYDAVNSHVEGYVPLSKEEGPHQWVSESLWDAKYRELLERPVDFALGDGGGKGNAADTVQEEPSILVLNTGPHWIGYEMVDHSIPETDVLKSYNNMIDKVLHNLTVNAPPADLKVFYRATSPGHESCAEITEPVVDNPRWNVTSDREIYNWHLLQPFNEAWKHRIDVATALTPQLDISYLDVWEMSLQRGDAKLLPPHDCLHFCYQGVVEEWQKFLWHEIVRESLNTDYGIEDRKPVYLEEKSAAYTLA